LRTEAIINDTNDAEDVAAALGRLGFDVIKVVNGFFSRMMDSIETFFRSAYRGLAVVGNAPPGAVIVYATDPGKTAAVSFTEAFASPAHPPLDGRAARPATGRPHGTGRHDLGGRRHLYDGGHLRGR
jgi:hypothetical protein